MIVERFIEYAEAADVAQELDDLEEYIDGAFLDGVVSAAEAAAIAEHIRQLNVEKADLDERYAALIANPLLTGTAAANLTSAKSAYDTEHAALLATIAAAIADGAITPTERTAVDDGFTAYETALGTLSQRFTEALDAIQPPVMHEEISEDGTTGTLTLTPLPGAVFDTVEFSTRSGNGVWSSWAADGSPPYSASVALDPKHPSAIAYRVSRDNDVIQQRVVAGFDIGTVANIGTPHVTPDGPTARISVPVDTDTATVVVERWNGTAWEIPTGWSGAPTDGVFVIAAADLSGVSMIFCRAYGLNAGGSAGPVIPFELPFYIPIPEPGPPAIASVSLFVIPINAGADDQYVVSVSTTGEVAGATHALRIELYAGGVLAHLEAAHDPEDGALIHVETAAAAGTLYEARVRLYELAGDQPVLSDVETIPKLRS